LARTTLQLTGALGFLKKAGRYLSLRFSDLIAEHAPAGNTIALIFYLVKAQLGLTDVAPGFNAGRRCKVFCLYLKWIAMSFAKRVEARTIAPRHDRTAAQGRGVAP